MPESEWPSRLERRSPQDFEAVRSARLRYISNTLVIFIHYLTSTRSEDLLYIFTVTLHSTAATISHTPSSSQTLNRSLSNTLSSMTCTTLTFHLPSLKTSLLSIRRSSTLTSSAKLLTGTKFSS